MPDWYWNRVGIYLPTYGRSEGKLPAHLHSVCSTVSSPDHVYYVLVINMKDKRSGDVAGEILSSYGVKYEILYENLPYPHFAHYANMCYGDAQNKDDRMIGSMVGDDMLFCTKDWDLKLLKAVNDNNGIGLFYCGGDERFDDALCVNAFLTRKFVGMCGCKFMCQLFPANGVDVVWQTATDCVGLSYYLADVIIRHEQCTRIHVGEDETYKRYRMFSKRIWRKNQIREESESRKIVDSLIRQGYKELYPLNKWVQRGKPGRHIING